MSRQLQLVGSKRIGLKDLRARLDVFKMDGFDKVAAREIQALKARINENALGIDHRTHRSIREDHAVAKGIEKRLRMRGCRHGSPLGLPSNQHIQTS
jgi:hypothetical protein